MTDAVLHVHVAEPLADCLSKAAETMEALDRGESVTPFFSIGFSDMGSLLAVLIPRRWQLISVVHERGPVSVSELARLIRCDAKQVAEDVEILSTWYLLDQDEKGDVRAPYRELVVDVKFPNAKAA